MASACCGVFENPQVCALGEVAAVERDARINVRLRKEVEALDRSQSVTGTRKHRDPRYPPYAFTEHGAVMLANVLKSSTAVEVSIQVVRAFIRFRETLASHAGLASKLDALEKKYELDSKWCSRRFAN